MKGGERESAERRKKGREKGREVKRGGEKKSCCLRLRFDLKEK